MNLVYRRSKSFYALCLLSGHFLRRFCLSKSKFWQTAALTERADDQWARVERALFTQFYLLRLEIMVRYYIETRFSAELGDYSSRVILFVRVAAPPVDLFFAAKRPALPQTQYMSSMTILRQHTRECDQMPLWPFLFSTLLRAAFCCILRLRIWARFEPFCRKEKEKGWNSSVHSSEKRKKKGRKNNFVEP